MTWDEIKNKYPNQWLVIEVLDEYTAGLKRGVTVLEECKDRAAGYAAYNRHRKKDRGFRIQMVHAEHRPPVLLFSRGEKLAELLGSEFPGREFLFDVPPNPVVTIESDKNPDLRILIYDERLALRVEIAGVSHKKFIVRYQNTGFSWKEDASVEMAIAFLHGVFSDQYVIYRSRTGDEGGWRHVNYMPEGEYNPENFEYFVWSGPYQPRPIMKK